MITGIANQVGTGLKEFGSSFTDLLTVPDGLFKEHAQR